MELKITNTYKIYEDNDVVHVLIHDGTNLQYNDAREIDAYVKTYSTNKKYLKLVDVRGSFDMEDKAKSFFGSPTVKLKITAQAILMGNNTKQQIIDLFSEMSTAKLPTKLFVDYDEAIKWLHTFKIKQQN